MLSTSSRLSLAGRLILFGSALGLTGLLGAIQTLDAQARTPGAPNEPPYYAIQNARIVVGNGEIIESGTLVIERGLITAVGENVRPPPEAWVIEGDGLTVYPGLIDGMTDIGLGRGERRGAGPGSSGNRQAGGSRQSPDPADYSRGPEDRPGTFTWRAAADHLSLEDARIKSWREQGFTSVLSVHQQGIFPGQASFLNLAGEEPEDLVINTPTALPIRLANAGGYRGYPGSLMGSFAYVKQLFADAKHYRTAWTLYRDEPRGQTRPRYDRSLAPLSDALAHKTPILIPGVWAKEISRAIELSRLLDVEAVIYGAHEAYSIAPEIKQSGASVLISANWPKADKDADPDAPISLRELRLRDRAPSAAKALSDAGVRFAFYSDGIDSPKTFLSNVKKAVDAGLSESEAIRALSLSAAEIYGLEDRLGSLETGKIANVIVTRGGLFDDEMKLESLFIDGTRLALNPTPKEENEATTEQTEPQGRVHR